MTFGSTDLSNTTVGTNQVPVSAVYVPNTASSNLTALEGIAVNTDGNSQKSSAARVGLKDGDDVALGTTTDASSANTLIGLTKAVKANTAVLPAQGQAAMAGSMPVVLASNQAAVPIGVVAGTALTADQSNTILKASLYVKKSANADTVIALGSATSANSLPVVLASDQGSFSVTANIGTTNGLALDSSVNGVLVSQGSTTSGEKGPMVQGAVTTNAPSYTTAQTSPLSLDTSGLLRASLKDTPANTNNLNVNLAASAAIVTVSASNLQTNVNQFGGSAIATGTGAGGAGIPRVTISNDSSLAANQSVNLNQVAGSAVATAASGIIKVGLTDGSGNVLNSSSNALNVSLQASGSNSATLQSAQTGNANGTSLTVLGMAAVTFTVTVSGFTGTVNFEGSEDNSNWSSLLCVQSGTTTTVTSTGVAGQFVASCAGLQSVRARTSGVTGGNVTVTGHAVPVSYGNVATAAGGANGSIGSTGAAVPASGTYIAANKSGNLTGLSLDASGNLNVNLAAGGGSGGTALSDDAAFTAGSTSFTPVGGVYNDSIANATSGHADAARITQKRAVHINPRDSSGNELLGSKTSANSVPVVIASDQGAVSVSASGNFNNASVGTNGSAIPGSSTQIGGSDGTNLRQLLVESSSNPNLRIGIYQAGLEASVGTFHSSDAQNLSGITNVLATGGSVPYVYNPAGLVDRQRSIGIDAVPAMGIQASGQNLAGPALTTTFNGAVTGSSTAQSVVVVSSASAKVGDMVTTSDNVETVEITAIADATHVTGIFKNNHANSASLTWYHYNQARDATIGDNVAATGLSPSATYLYNQGSGNFEFDRSANGEKDGASGQGTAVAAEYEYNANPLANGSVLSGLQFDRARNVQGGGLGSGTISNNPLAANSTTLTLNSAPTTLDKGMQIVLDRAGANPETNYVASSYTPGSTSVALQIATQFSHAQNSTVEWSQHAPLGPQLNGFLPSGLGMEEEIVYDPVSKKYFIEIAATGDANSGQNLVVESPGLYNNATFDRARSAYGDALATTGIEAASEMLWNGASFDRARSIAIGDGAASTGIGADGIMLYNGSTYDRLKGDNTGEARVSLYAKNAAAGDTVLIAKPANVSPTLADAALVTAISPNNSGLPVNLPVIVQKGNNVTGSAGKTLTFTFGSNTTKGNSIVVVMGMGEVEIGGGSPITLAVTDSQSNTFTEAVKVSQSTTLEAAIFYTTGAIPGTGIAGGADTVTITIAGSGSSNTAIAAEVYEVSGLITLTPGILDQTSTGSNAGSTSPATGAISPIVPNEYAFVALAAGGGTVTAGTNWNLDSGSLAPTGGNLVSFGSESQPLTTIASVTGTATLSASNAWAIALATFKTVILPIEGSINLQEVGGAALTLGQNTMANSVPVAIASNQSNVPTNVMQFGGNTVATGTGAGGAGIPRVTVSNDSTVGANSATGSAVPANAFYHGGIAETSLPTAATAGNLTGLMVDKFGRLIVMPYGMRDIQLPIAQLTLTSTTTETTLISAVASQFSDITGIIAINTSATATQVDFRDSTGGTIRFSLYIPAGDTRGFSTMFFGQNAVNNNWTAKCGTSVASVIITGTYVANK